MHALLVRRARFLRPFTVALGLAVLVPAVVWAHGALKSSQPASGAHLAAAPREIRLDFTDAPEVRVSRIELRGPDGKPVALGPLGLAIDSRRSLLAAIQGPLIAGTYTVSWQFAGADGHPIRGTFTFTIAPGASGTGSIEQPAAAHHDPVSMPAGSGFDAESPAYVAIRWVLFAGLLVVVGAVAFRYIVLRFLALREGSEEGRKHHSMSSAIIAMRDRAAAVGVVGAAVVLIALFLRLIAQSYAMHGGVGAWDTALIGTMVTSTRWGWAWVAQLAGGLVAFVGYLLARRGTCAGWTIAALGALVLAFTPAFSGHAATAPQLTSLAILADGLHVISAGGWLGSLLLVIGVGIPVALRGEEAIGGRRVADLVNAFSPTALVFAGLLGATGLFTAWLHLGGISALWESTYGRTLLIKLAILSIVAATGAYNWLRVRPALGDVEGARRIRRSSTVELAAGLVVLLVTAVLVATPPPMEMGTTRAAQSIGTQTAPEAP